MSQDDPNPYEPDEGQGTSMLGDRKVDGTGDPTDGGKRGEIGEAPSIAADEPDDGSTYPGRRRQRHRGGGRPSGRRPGAGRLTVSSAPTAARPGSPRRPGPWPGSWPRPPRPAPPSSCRGT